MSIIPDQKHSDDELSRLRAQSAMQAANSSIVETYNKKLANKGIVIFGYALPLIAPAWLMVKKMTENTVYSMNDFYIMAIPICLALVIALWIGLLRVLSRHNAAFILMLSLFCCFALVSAVNASKSLKYDLMSLVGKEGSMSDPLLEPERESDEQVSNIGTSMTEEDHETLKKAREEYKKEREEWLKRKAEREKVDTKSP